MRISCLKLFRQYYRPTVNAKKFLVVKCESAYTLAKKNFRRVDFCQSELNYSYF